MAVSLREVVSFGRYEPLFRIASGGMAEVFAARIRGEAGFQKLVAVKRMHPHMASDQSFVDMFLNEARLAANISSPNVVQTMDLGRGSDGSLYIVMELVVGLSLAALTDIRQSPLPVPIVLALMAQAAQGLDDAHEATTPAGDELGLVHRDISPHNILVGLDGRARVTDFGIARAVHAPRSETNVKELKGKFAYMSPEQTRLKPLDHRTDVFSLGVVIWELLVGDKLFADLDAGLTIKNVRGRSIDPPHERVPAVPEEVSAVVMKALERLPAKRYQSAGVLAEALRTAAGRLPSRKRVAEFVRETGGEELERLQRLIRLGTEGAEEEAFEKVRPGSTQVLGTADASGISRVVDGTDLGASEPRIDKVVLPDDDEASFEDDVALEEIIDESEPGAGAKPTRNLRALRYKRRAGEEPPTLDLPHPEPTTREFVKVKVDPTAPPLVREVDLEPRSTLRWILLGIVAGSLIVAATSLSVWMVSEAGQSDAVPMPLAPETTLDVEPTGPEPAAGTRPEPEHAAAIEPAADPRGDSAAEPDPEPGDDVTATTADPEPEPEGDAVPTPEATDGDAPVPVEPASARRRRRRRGASARRSRSDPGEAPLILDVNEFDQRPR